MLTVKDIYDYINEIAPFCEQCEWDNSGILVGDGNAPVHKIGVVLDITPDAVRIAREKGVDLIISHHPVIFSPLTQIRSDTPSYLLAHYGINAICAHTSLDAAVGGVNDTLADTLGFTGVKTFVSQGEEKILRFCLLNEAITAPKLADIVKDKLGAPVILCQGENKIKKIAFCGGAGGDFVDFVIKNGCDAYITGELRHHEMLAAKQSSLTAIVAGHFATENPIVAVLSKKLAARFDVPVVIIEQSAPAIIY